MEDIYFKILFLFLWMVYIVIRVPHAKRYKFLQKVKKVGSGTEKVLLSLMSVGLMLLPLVWIVTSWFDRFALGFSLWLRILGIIISVWSLFYFYKIHRTLGANWSPTLEIMDSHKLIKSGPYRLVRHPMYAQIWLWTIAQALIISNGIAGFSGLIVWAILYFVRVPKEEKMMEETFDEEYRSYSRHTGRVFPKFFNRKH